MSFQIRAGISRRVMLGRTAALAAAGAVAPQLLSRAATSVSAGAISGEPAGGKARLAMLADGGNVVDGIVTAALVAAVSSPQNTGMGGYGGHMTLAVNGGRKVTCIDFNTAAPRAARSDMFPLDENGQVKGRRDEFGWMAAGVPGILAGMQLALERYGTRSFAQCVQPAIALARDGFKLTPGLATTMRGCAEQFRIDEGSRKLYLPHGEPPAAGDTFRNPDLAAMLETLAKRNSTDNFYRGDIARRISAAFQKHGGLVTTEDLAAYRAREVAPLSLSWRGFEIWTAPLTAGGLTILQALATLRALKWDEMPAGFPRVHAGIEALRFAWHDRLRLFGDPTQSQVPVERLLSQDYAAEAANQVRSVVEKRTLLPFRTEAREQPGTIHLSALDREGNMAACTLTHGGSFGARVTVDGLGLTLGHGMSRFDPRPEHPNAPGPAKRPLHNMCPSIVCRDGRAVAALGARGGRQIPNALFQVLAQHVGLGRSLADAIAAPRMHTEGGPEIKFEKTWSPTDVAAAKEISYSVKTGPSAIVSAVSIEGAKFDR